MRKSNILFGNPKLSIYFQCRAPYMVIAEKATGKIGKHVTSVCVILTLYGSCCVVIVLMGGFLENIANYANPDIGMR